jgi:hypothetical protein
MNDTKQNARRALTITTVLTLFVASAEILIAYSNYRKGMNFLDLTSYVTSNKYIYFLILIVGNMALLPSAVLLYKVRCNIGDINLQQFHVQDRAGPVRG